MCGSIGWRQAVLRAVTFSTDVIEAEHLFQFAAAGRDEDHRQVGVAAHLAQRVETIHARQPDIEQDEVRSHRGDLRLSLIHISEPTRPY